MWIRPVSLLGLPRGVEPRLPAEDGGAADGRAEHVLGWCEILPPSPGTRVLWFLGGSGGKKLRVSYGQVTGKLRAKLRAGITGYGQVTGKLRGRNPYTNFIRILITLYKNSYKDS